MRRLGQGRAFDLDHRLQRTARLHPRLAQDRPLGERGRPHLVPCCFALDGDIMYSAVDAKPKSTVALRRLATLRANRDAALLVDFCAEDWSTLWWVRVDGRGSVIETVMRARNAWRRHRELSSMNLRGAAMAFRGPGGSLRPTEVLTWEWIRSSRRVCRPRRASSSCPSGG